MTAITTAARLLRVAADELKNAHTLGGDWGNEHEALDAYNEHMATATTLEHMARQCLAQIEEPAQPIAGYRISDPSDPTIKPWLSETPDDNGYTSEPLYAGAAPVATFQARVQPWLLACFGAEIAADRSERNHRFLEESLELVQSCGCTASEAHQLVDYVFGRPVGEPAQEAGGVMVTLAALCLANSLDMHEAGETELARIWTKVEAIRAKQAAKPKHSPLPAAPAAVAGPADPLVWTPGPNEFKDWCAQWFGPDSDDNYLAEAVHALPPMAQRFARLAAAPALEAPAAPATSAQVQALHRARRALHAIGKTYDDSELRTRALEADEEIDRMLAAAPQTPAQEAPAAPAVPAGFALVPIEPTQQMLDAGRWSGAGSVSIQEEWARKEMWSRMLATITPPPAAYTDDLVALVENLAQALSAAAPDNDLAGHALNYLKRNGLQESPLRAAEAAPQAPAAPAEAQRLAQFLQRMRTHLGSCRESAGTYNQQAWDDYERAWTMLLGMAAPSAPSAIATQVIENLLQLARIVNTAVEDWGETKEDDSLEVIFQKEEADKMESILEFFDSLPDAPEGEGVILSGPSRAARVLRAMAPAAPAVDAETSEDAERFRAMGRAVLGESGALGRYPELGDDATIDDVRAVFDAAIAAQAAAKGE